jgi:hypothetical protein
MTSAEKIAYLNMLGKQVADILTTTYNSAQCGIDGAWEFVTSSEDNWNVYMQNKLGARIYLSLACSKGYQVYDRVSVSGHMHIGKNGSYVEVYDRGADGTGWNRVSAPSITVASSKNPEAIAKDIAKRFLPEYLRVFALAQAKVQADADYDAAITANLQRLAKVAGETLPSTQQRYGQVNSSFHFRVGQRYYDVTASAKDCSMKMISLSIEQCEFIIRYLKTGK